MTTEASPEGPLYLGLDLSTQQLKAIVVASDLRVVAEAKVDFDADFGRKYGVTKGVLVNEAEGEVYAPVALFLEAIDLVFARLRDRAGGPGILARVRAVSGACQQHGSVYWAGGAAEQLAGLQSDGGPGDVAAVADAPLVDRLAQAFARPWAPNWQDQSTQAECDALEACLATQPGGGDGAQALADATGSAAHHRFTGPQIMRIRRRWPAAYAQTARIALISSFVASVLLGRFAPADSSDVCGMGLWDIPAQQWSEPLLARVATDSADAAEQRRAAADLRQKLGAVRADGGGSLGPVAAYFVRRYGLAPACAVAPFTGDNPATILALPLRPLDAIVSLGTSTTFLMVTPHYKPHPSYHVFNHPTSPGQYMFMLCYKNGGLAREKVRDALREAKTAPDSGGSGGGDGSDPWATFNQAVLDAPVLGIGSDHRARLGLYFYLNEIVPNIPAGTWRFTCNADGSDLKQDRRDDDSRLAELDARTIVESQALSMRLRARPLLHEPPAASGTAAADGVLPAQPRRIYLVGGGSLNPAIAQVLGAVLGGAEGVYRLDVGGNACALGGAYKALWALERADEHETLDALLGRRWTEAGAIEKIDPGYRPAEFAQYGRVLDAFARMEHVVLDETRRDTADRTNTPARP